MLPDPRYIGLPEKFTSWRKDQSEAVESIIDSEERFLIQVCPTGFGKSLTYISAASLTSGRTVVLTSTKGLQSQLIRDFGEMEGVADIRGRGNYPCRLNTERNCDLGLCVFGVKCSMKDQGGCFYFDALRKAKKAKIVITNYAYWMSQNEYGEGIGKFNLLVCDEAHSSPNHVIDHISVTFSKVSGIENEVLGLSGRLPNRMGDWVAWASSRLDDVRDEIQTAKIRRREKVYIKLNRLEKKLSRLVSNMDSSWIWEVGKFDITLTPKWPAPYSENVLFLDVPKVVLTSAFVVPKTANLLGIPEDECRMEEFPHSFPLENRRVIHLPTTRVNFRIDEIGLRLLFSKMDNIIRPRLGTKGIIHTVSYARRDMVLNRSKFSEHMMTHDTKTAEKKVKMFKEMDAPCILVSPSMTTGWDFPDDECRWQIIIKVPFPDTRGHIMKTRANGDKDFVSYIVMQQLIQTAGRGVRSEDDWCETFIIDNSIGWFLKQNKHLSVEWFMEAYCIQTVIPEPKGGEHE